MSRREPSSHPLAACRRPFFRRFARGAALASTWGVLVCAQAGCLIPQTVDAIVASPHVPPQIGPENIPDYLQPRVLTLYQQGASDVTSSPPCHCQLEFDRITVDEQLSPMLPWLRAAQGVAVAGLTLPPPAAEEGGLQPVDVILAANGRSVATLDELRALVSGLPAGSSLALHVNRRGRLIYVALEIE